VVSHACLLPGACGFRHSSRHDPQGTPAMLAVENSPQ
jgi:hypothetical protein